MFSNTLEFKQDFERRLSEKYGKSVALSHITERYAILGEMVRDYAGYNWRNTQETVLGKNSRQLVYFSMEFLIGRLLVNNMMNLGIYHVVKDGLKELGIDINELEEQESDAGLGNGGLGRLAACFMDSIASLGYPGHGNCIRYEYGFFKQKIIDGKQTELPDQWLTNGNVWEVRKPKHAVEVKFYGNAETYLKPDGEYAIRTVNAVCVKAVPYDVSIVGYRNGIANTLRLWSAEPSENNLPTNQSFSEYLNTLRELCLGLYPDDSTEDGRILRLRQQYFLVSAGIQSAIQGHLRHNKSLINFKDCYVFQLNDTHPILAIPEMMRLLLDEYDFSWDEAWEQVTHCIAFTNHTVMPEALEKWPIQYMQKLFPRCFMIIEEINRRFNIELNEKGVANEKKQSLQIIKDGQIYMSNLSIYACFSVNGVAALHTKILESLTFKDFYDLYPEKFNNKTNGVTHRRWFLYANPRLAKLVTSKIGDTWIRDFSKIEKFKEFVDEKTVQEAFLKTKREAKLKFKQYFEETFTKFDITIDENSIFDVQIKRLHAYKRQLMNIFHIMYLYQRMKDDQNFRIYPTTFIFGAKAAPSYEYAKKIIELILAVAKVIDTDEEINKYMKVIFVENYGVSIAETLIPASDVSEQISLAGKEASGTSNMKFMMNGAITLGTLDGANIEINDRVGKDNDVIFGLTADEVENIQQQGTYNPWDIYNSDSRVKNVIDSLFTGPWADNRQDRFRLIFDEIMNRNDEYMILKDFDSYVKAHEKIQELYKDQNKWARMCLVNIASSGFFSSDRTIEQYNKDIWHLKKMYKESDLDGLDL